MARRVDDRKRADWARRLARFEASGLSVTRFCEAEGVSAASFHYWARRVNAERKKAVPSKRIAGATPPPTGAAPVRSPMLSDAPSPAVVRVRLEGGVELTIPADCLDAIASAVRAAREPAGSSPASSAFHRIVVADR